MSSSLITLSSSVEGAHEVVDYKGVILFGLGRIRDRYYKWCESVKFLSRNKGMRAGKNLDLRLS